MLAMPSRSVRSERELAATLGAPLLAARPLRHEALRALCEQLLEHWLRGARRLLPVVSARAGDGRTTLTLELARMFAALGEPTLLVDGDLRAHALHARLGAKNREGLGDGLDGRAIRVRALARMLALLPAGRVREDPLELLSRPCLWPMLNAAAQPFRVVLVDTPAAQRGPDYEMFAALAGGALAVLRRGADGRGLLRLARRLSRCNALLVGAVIVDA